MENLSIIPECFIDTCLTETITNATHFNHQKGCGAVSRLMQGKLKDRFALGIIDKDKMLLPYLNEFDLLGNKGSIYLYRHRQKPHYIIQIAPAIEKFILKAAEEQDINLSDFHLPATLKELTRITKNVTSGDNPVFKQLFRSLSAASEFVILSDIIRYISTHTYNCNMEELQAKMQ
jgi:hypothetical protein